jgi:hypothetical protein
MLLAIFIVGLVLGYFLRIFWVQWRFIFFDNNS